MAYSLPEAQYIQSWFLPRFYAFIIELEISKWRGTPDCPLAMATLTWTSAQPFTSYLRQGATELDEIALFRWHAGLHRKAQFHLSVTVPDTPTASPVPHHHTADSFTPPPAFCSHTCRSPVLCLEVKTFLSKRVALHLPLCTYPLLQFVGIVSEFHSIFILSRISPNRKGPQNADIRCLGHFNLEAKMWLLCNRCAEVNMGYNIHSLGGYSLLFPPMKGFFLCKPGIISIAQPYVLIRNALGQT